MDRTANVHALPSDASSVQIGPRKGHALVLKHKTRDQWAPRAVGQVDLSDTEDTSDSTSDEERRSRGARRTGHTFGD